MRQTLNAGVAPEQALWQYRIGLNVAALNCRGPDDQILIDNYTRFLATNRSAIARAERWVIADQGRRTGTNGVSARDTLSTRLYNYFAQPPVLGDFCRVARGEAALAAVEPSATILTFAAAHLPIIDQPFVDFYAAYDRYRADLARWQALQPLPPITTVPTPAPASVVPPPSTTPATRPPGT